MTPVQFFGGLVGFAILMVWFTLAKLKNRALCRYHRASKQIIEKAVKIDDNHVIFDGLEFTIVPGRASLQWYDKGLLGWFRLGTWVVSYDFSRNSKYPHDPNQFSYNGMPPALAKLFNRESAMAAFARGVQKQTGIKQGKFEKWLPWIAILLILVIAFYLNSQLGNLNAHMAAVENTVRATGGH